MIKHALLSLFIFGFTVPASAEVDAALLNQLAHATAEAKLPIPAAYNYWYTQLYGIETAYNNSDSHRANAVANQHIREFFMRASSTDPETLAKAIANEEFAHNPAAVQGAYEARVKQLMEMRKTATPAALSKLRNRVEQLQTITSENARLTNIHEYRLSVENLATQLRRKGQQLPASIAPHAEEHGHALMNDEVRLTEKIAALNARDKLGHFPKYKTELLTRPGSVSFDLVAYGDAPSGRTWQVMKSLTTRVSRGESLVNLLSKTSNVVKRGAVGAAVAAATGLAASAANARTANTVGASAASINKYPDEDFGPAGTR